MLRTFDTLYSESCKSLNSGTVSAIRLIGSSRKAIMRGGRPGFGMRR